MKKLNPILITLAFIILLFSIFLINNKLNTIISDLSNKTDRLEIKINGLSSYISSLEANYNYEMKKQASLFEDFTLRSDEINPDDLSLLLHISLIPKSLSDETIVTLTLGDETYPLTREKNHFKLSFPINVLERYKPYVTIIEGDISRNEKLNEIDYSYLVFDTVKTDIIEKLIYKGGTITFKDTTISLMHSSFLNASLKEGRLYATVNDKEVYTKDITKDIEYNNSVSQYQERFNYSFDISSNDEFLIFIELTETNGIKYELFVFGLLFSKDGSDLVQIDSNSYLIDKEGNRHSFSP